MEEFVSVSNFVEFFCILCVWLEGGGSAVWREFLKFSSYFPLFTAVIAEGTAMFVLFW